MATELSTLRKLIKSGKATGADVDRFMELRNTPEDRFALAAKRVRESRGGYPKATYEGGQFVFTYPNGTKTIGGKVVSL